MVMLVGRPQETKQDKQADLQVAVDRVVITVDPAVMEDPMTEGMEIRAVITEIRSIGWKMPFKESLVSIIQFMAKFRLPVLNVRTTNCQVNLNKLISSNWSIYWI